MHGKAHSSSLSGAAALLFICLASTPVWSEGGGGRDFDEGDALRYSQSAIGRTLGDLTFTDSNGTPVRLGDYRGKPLVLNFIYTRCAHSCGVMTSLLADILEDARNVLGEDSFTAITVGFETARDTPEQMRLFARQRGVHGARNWHFLSGDEETVRRLAETAGFIYFPSSKGFDHLAQVTVIDGEGRINTQVYGETFNRPLLIEPLKAMVFGTPNPYLSLEDLIKKVRLFCTLYDPAADRYRFDYSLFMQLFIGATIIGGVMVILVRELWSARRRRHRERSIG
jgi:protein SCO1/2